MAVLVARCRDDGGDTALGYGQEMMRRRGRANGVNGDFDVAVRAVLEADRAGQPGRQLAVDLRFRRTSANSAPADEVGDVLRRNHVEELTAARHAHLVEADHELARYTQA